MHGHQLCFEDVKTGTALTPLVKRPTTIQLFRFSAVTWNAHRIHFDKPYAATEGYPDVLVQAHLHGSFLYQAVADWAGKLAGKSPVIMRLGKEAMRRQLDMPLDDALDYLRAQLTLALSTEDVAEGVSAFFEKREPQWKGR